MPDQSPAASPLFLREAEVRRGADLLLLGHARLMAALDDTLNGALAGHRLGRAHFRALYFIARHPDITVGDLSNVLGITKQSLGRILTDLLARELCTARPGRSDRRQKLLRLTEAGNAVEAQLFAVIRERLGAAYGHAGQHAVTGFWQVLEGLSAARP